MDCILGRVIRVERGKRTFIPGQERSWLNRFAARLLARSDAMRKISLRAYRVVQLIENRSAIDLSEPESRLSCAGGALPK
jgi:hypothetical protein